MGEVKTQGVHHVGLTVPNLADAVEFFCEVLGFEQVREVPSYPAVFVSDGTVMITLWQAETPSEARPFDRKHAIGLHHLALKLPSMAALHATHARLVAWPGAAVEFPPEPLGDAGLMHLMCSAPGGVRLELVAGG